MSNHCTIRLISLVSAMQCEKPELQTSKCIGGKCCVVLNIIILFSCHWCGWALPPSSGQMKDSTTDHFMCIFDVSGSGSSHFVAQTTLALIHTNFVFYQPIGLQFLPPLTWGRALQNVWSENDIDIYCSLFYCCFSVVPQLEDNSSHQWLFSLDSTSWGLGSCIHSLNATALLSRFRLRACYQRICVCWRWVGGQEHRPSIWK